MQDKDQPYRQWVKSELRSFRLRIEQSDILVGADRDLTVPAENALKQVRSILHSYIAHHPEFATALEPHEVPASAPFVIRRMADAARLCGVGPMAAVAGAVAQYIGEALLAESSQVIVENGGDIFLYTLQPRTVAVYAGKSPLSGRVGIRINATHRQLGLCTSSGTVGPSLSFGRADAAVVVAESAFLADAAATALGNRVTDPNDIEDALEFLNAVPGILGAVTIVGDQLGAWGEVELVRVEPGDTGMAWQSR